MRHGARQAQAEIAASTSTATCAFFAAGSPRPRGRGVSTASGRGQSKDGWAGRLCARRFITEDEMLGRVTLDGIPIFYCDIYRVCKDGSPIFAAEVYDSWETYQARTDELPVANLSAVVLGHQSFVAEF